MGLFSRLFGSQRSAVENKRTGRNMKEVPPPTSGKDCEILQRWSQVAFSARCARRVQPILAAALKDLPQKHIVAVDRAISIAEQASSSAMPPTVDLGEVLDTLLAAEEATGFANLPRNPLTSAHYAYAVVSITQNSIQLIEHPDPVTTSSSANFACAACGYITQSPESVIPISCLFPISKDLATLRDHIEKSHVTDDIPVPIDTFGPLWPEGVPVGWPDAVAIRTDSTTTDDSSEDAITYFEQGKALLVSGDLQGGAQAFRNALEASPEISEKIYNVALELRRGADVKRLLSQKCDQLSSGSGSLAQQ